jgi:hypothetical protein
VDSVKEESPAPSTAPSPRQRLSSATIDAASAKALLAEIQSMPFAQSVSAEIKADPVRLSQHKEIVRDIKQHISVLKDSLPTYADVLEDISVVLCTILTRNITRSEAAITKVKNSLHSEAMDRDTRDVLSQIRLLEQAAAVNAAKFAEFEEWRKTRLDAQQRRIASVRAEMASAKVNMETRLQEVAQANERIAALYQRHIEARRFVNSVADIKEQETQLLADIEMMSDHKNSLNEQLLEHRKNHAEAMNALATEKIELEASVFQIKTKLGTVDRKVGAVKMELAKKQLELKAQIEANAGLRQSQQEWQEKLAAREAFEWRAQTPRPAHDDPTHGLLRHVDVPRGSSSTAIVDAGLRKLSALSTAGKKQFEELLRLSRVIRPLSSIVLYTQIDPSQGFRDHEADHIIVTPSSDLMSFVSHAEHPVNERWSQATTERHALAMFKVLPIMPLTSNSPQNRVNEAMTKWCMSPEYSGPGFPANFVLSLRTYSRVSPICKAGLLTLYAKVPLGFGDSVLQFFSAATQSSEASMPLRNLQSQIAKQMTKEGSCLGSFFGLQAKLAASLDSASNGANVKITSLMDIVEHKRNSGLLLRTVFAHLLFQDQTIRQAMYATAMSCGRSSLTTAKDVLVHEPTFRAKLETLRWDPELFHGTGVRYGPTNRLVALNAKPLADQLLAGLSRIDGGLHRLDEGLQLGTAKHGAKGSGPKAGKEEAQPGKAAKEYLQMEALLAAIAVVPIRTVDVRASD